MTTGPAIPTDISTREDLIEHYLRYVGGERDGRPSMLTMLFATAFAGLEHPGVWIVQGADAKEVGLLALDVLGDIQAVARMLTEAGTDPTVNLDSIDEIMERVDRIVDFERHENPTWDRLPPAFRQGR